MKLGLVSHVRGDDDILESWLKYYLRLGVASFHLVVHGRKEENRRLFALKDYYPVVIEDTYQGEFDSEEKKWRLNALLAKMRGQWLVLADSDEFVEFPYRKIPTTIRVLKLGKKDALFAPMVQHLTPNGTLETPELVDDPFRTFPLCSVDLYQKMGVKASIDKYPLFYCGDKTELVEGGNHNCPTGELARTLQGATHHFKFRRAVSERLDNRINSSHPWRQESVQYREFLDSNAGRLPTEDAFQYSRPEMFRRGLLRRPSFLESVGKLLRQVRKSTGTPVAKKAA